MKKLAALLLVLACSGTYGRVRADEVSPREPATDPAGAPVDTAPVAGEAPIGGEAPVADATPPAGAAPIASEPAVVTPVEATPTSPPVVQATDDERVPMSRSARVRPTRPPEPQAQTETLASPIPPPPDPLAGRRYPESASRRPLTLAEGVWRLDHALDWNVMHFAVEAPNTLTAGVLNDLEIGVAWPWTRDPTLFATVRFFSSDVIDLGVRASARLPAVTTGDTVVRAAIPVVIRPTRHVRIQTGLDVELLLTPQISPWAWIPLQIMGNPVPSMFLGAQGSIGWLDGARVTGQAGLFVGHTVSATPTGHPIFEIRWTTSYMFELNDLHITCAVSFFPRFW